MVNDQCKVWKKKKERWKIFLLEETRSKKATLYMCLVITESRTDFTFQLQHLIANYIDLVHKILILREFMDLMLLFSCGWELKKFALSCWMCVACVLQYVHASAGVETIQNCLKRLFTRSLDCTAEDGLVQIPCPKQGQPEHVFEHLKE